MSEEMHWSEHLMAFVRDISTQYRGLGTVDEPWHKNAEDSEQVFTIGHSEGGGLWIIIEDRICEPMIAETFGEENDTTYLNFNETKVLFRNKIIKSFLRCKKNDDKRKREDRKWSRLQDKAARAKKEMDTMNNSDRGTR